MLEVALADHMSILHLYARYAHAIDSGNGHEYASCYSSEGRYRSSTFGQATGYAELNVFAVEHYRRWMDQGVQTRHWNNQVLLTGEPDGSITGSVYVLLFGVRAGEQPQPLLQTVYTDKLLRTGDGWRLLERVSNADSSPDPARFGFSRWQGQQGFE